MPAPLTIVSCLLLQSVVLTDTMGTWKLNTMKSKYTGVLAPKDVTVVYSPAGPGWRYDATTTTTAGQQVRSSFQFVKDGAEIRTAGFPNWDAIVLNGADSNKMSIEFRRAGQPVGKGSRIMSTDRKTMTIRAELTTPDGKKATYVSVYEKQ